MMKTILLADPDASISQLLSTVFADEYEITPAHSLQEAIDLLSSRRFDLIITEAFDQSCVYEFDPSFLVRLKPVAAGTPIIVFSTYASPSMSNGSEYGLAGVLPKPTELSEVIVKVNRALGQGKSRVVPPLITGSGPRAA